MTGQRRQEFTRIPIQLAPGRFVVRIKLIDNLIDRARAVTQSPNPRATLIHRHGGARTLCKQQKAVVRELMRLNVRLANREIHIHRFEEPGIRGLKKATVVLLFRSLQSAAGLRQR